MAPTAHPARGLISRFFAVATRVLLSILLVGFASSLLSSLALAQNEEAFSRPTVVEEVGHTISLPMREMPTAVMPSPESRVQYFRNREVPLGRTPLVAPLAVNPQWRDPALQELLGPQVGTTNLLNFEGQGAVNSCGTGCNARPPDTDGSVGDTQYVQVVNDTVAVYSKTTGALLHGPVLTNTFFSALTGVCSTTDRGDGIVLYDKLARRWLISQFAHDTNETDNHQCIAVSTSSDATGSYNQYDFPFGTTFNDYGKFGVWPDAYYFSANMYTSSGTFIGAEVCAYNRTAILAGNTAASICFGPSSSEFTLLPSDLDGATPPSSGEPNFFVDIGGDLHSLHLFKFHVDFTTPSNSTFTGPATISVAPFTLCSNANCIPQAGTATLLDSLTFRLMFRLAYRNFGDHESLVANHTAVANATTSQTGVRWYEIRNPNGTPTVFQQSTFAPDSSSRWTGSIAMDSFGDIALGYSISSSAINPGINYTGRVPTDPLNTMEAETTIINGSGSQTPGNRWGDYSGMSIDPSDDCTFFYTNEYLTANGDFNWHTRIASFKFPSCGSGTTTYSLTVSKAGTGSGTVTSTDSQINCGTSCLANYSAGTQVTLNAAAAAGSVFGGWGGACTGLGSCSVTMNSNVGVMATFNPTGSATVTTTAATLISGSGATINGLANANNTSTNAWFEWGTSSSLATFTQTGSASISGSGTWYIWFALTGLSPGTTYYYRIAASNSAGTVKGSIRNFTAQAQDTSGALQFIQIPPCRVADTRNATGPFGGPSIGGQSSRNFVIPSSACGIPPYAAAYSLNVTVVPHGGLGYLSVWPSGQSQPLVSTLNSIDGRVKANAAIVPAGTNGAISVFATDPTDVVLDINGYFVPGPNPSALAFYPLTPCRIADTRSSNGPLGGPYLVGGQSRTLPILSSSCQIPASAQAYSLNFTAVPRVGTLGWLSAWPSGQAWPGISTLNAPTGTVTANAAIVPAGSNGAINVMSVSGNDTDMVLDINGYFAPVGSGALSLYALTPCRVVDTRNTTGSFNGPLTVDVKDSSCGAPPSAQAFALNATVVPAGSSLGYLTLWPNGASQPFVSTLNALDGMVTSNMAIVPTANGSISAFSTNATQLVLDINGYFAP